MCSVRFAANSKPLLSKHHDAPPRRSVSALALAAGSHKAPSEAPDLWDPCEIHHLRPRPHPARFVASSREGSHSKPD